MRLLHRENFAQENPSDRHDAQRRRERAQEKQRRLYPVGERRAVAAEPGHADEQVAQRTHGYAPQHQEPLAQSADQQDREHVAEHAERRVDGLWTVEKHGVSRLPRIPRAR